jgi:hypothetical protein
MPKMTMGQIFLKRAIWVLVESVFLVAAVTLPQAARADFEVAGPDGRRILLMDNGTWRYVEAKEKVQADDKIKEKEKEKEKGEAILSLEQKLERGPSCAFALSLVNNLPYEIRSFSPYYAAYRANGVIYDTVSSGAPFSALKPGDKQRGEIMFRGIACREIVRVQVVGGDRCDMGDLDKFSATKGQCLARVRVVESALLRFDK